ncbi:hypothetical protein BDV27DRAFT_79076 [Aspergillus caelatus]|uniref:Uncharacterized protein n=1 Tax=Aspergillus caelatus TaxID=61420 RepID=A0A5N7AKG8_9EURO|nr:uncharacterized protein BDV27DRAFT_79076 [Aspergillus caelatus]KAE8370341.1 hypothetical protein BDV27DRAFT_79076 [Aspergillus caelatus]
MMKLYTPYNTGATQKLHPTALRKLQYRGTEPALLRTKHIFAMDCDKESDLSFDVFISHRWGSCQIFEELSWVETLSSSRSFLAC